MANILSISEVSKLDTLKEYLNYLSTSLQSHELDSIRLLCEEFQSINSPDVIFDGYMVGYKIPQISKEFDLLRIGSNLAIDIELKSRYNHDDILKQLQRNKYYLKFLNRDIRLFTFVSDSKKIYELSVSGDSINEINKSQLVKALVQQSGVDSEKIDTLFNPSNYLVSPFNSTEKFINNEYFLTSQQENIKNFVIERFSINLGTLISIEGKPGTGKTLLLYDIAKTLSTNGSQVMVVHVGKLNEGHLALRDIYGFNVMPIITAVNAINSLSESGCDCVIIDETQRIRREQLSGIISVAHKFNINIIIGFDSRQVLHQKELLSTSLNLVREKSIKQFALTEKIRTNQNVSHFIKALFDLNRKISYKINNVGVVYFSNYSSARKYIDTRIEYSLLNYTPSTMLQNRNPIDMIELSVNNKGNAHEVIGQEFDNVIAIIDDVFYYDSNGSLKSKDRPGVPYDQLRMLFQIVTRTRNKLEIVVVNNEPVFKEILKIIKGR